MTLYAHKFTFTKITTGTSNVSQEVNLSLPSAPKALWLFAVPVTANNTYNEGISWSYGYSDGTDDACMAYSSQDDSDPTTCNHVFRNDNIICLFSTTTPTTVLARANVTTFDTDGFTLNWVTNNSSAYIIHGYVVGGTDITNAKVINTTVGTESTGNADYTGFGFSSANFVNIMTTHDGNLFNTADGEANISIGAAVSSTKRWNLGGYGQTAQGTSDTYHFYMNNQVASAWDRGNGNVRAEADFVSFITDGLRLNWTDAPVDSAQPISFLLIKGGLWDVGDFAANNTTNNQIISLASGITADLFAVFGVQTTSTDTGTPAPGTHSIMIGGVDKDSDQGHIWGQDVDGESSGAVTAMQSRVDEVIRVSTAAATASSSTLLGSAVIASMASAEEVELDWTDAINYRFGWFAVGQTPAPKNMFISKAYFYADA
jgi:hypothetical protein